MKVLVLGGAGQLGTDLVKTGRGITVYSRGRREADVTDEAELTRQLASLRPEWVINAAAYNKTEEAEKSPDQAFSANSLGARNVARAAAAASARVIYISTDFVFDGRKPMAYVESDPVRPLGAYGVSKLAGEHFTLAANPDNLVVRTASLFGRAGSGGKGGNFVETIRSRAIAGEPLEVVQDIVMSPTYTRDLAEKIWELIQKDVDGGIYHVVNSGSTSWHQFALEIIAQLGLSARVTAIPASLRRSAFRRSPNTALESERLPALGIPRLRPWREALAAYLAEKPA